MAVVGVEAGAQLVEAAHNPDNLATSDRPRVGVTLVPDQSEDSVKYGPIRGSASYLMTGLARPLTTCHLPCGVSTRPLSVSTISGLLAWPPGDLGHLESVPGEAGEAEHIHQ